MDGTATQKTISREEVVALIRLMVSLDQRRQAKDTYLLANETHPWWELRKAFEDDKAKLPDAQAPEQCLQT